MLRFLYILGYTNTYQLCGCSLAVVYKKGADVCALRMNDTRVRCVCEVRQHRTVCASYYGYI